VSAEIETGRLIVIPSAPARNPPIVLLVLKNGSGTLEANSTAPAAARVRAADHVLDHSKKAIESEDIEVRVAALELAAKLANRRWEN
jgi:hypothetical protein